MYPLEIRGCESPMHDLFRGYTIQDSWDSMSWSMNWEVPFAKQ